jgi:hypothetical protein
VHRLEAGQAPLEQLEAPHQVVVAVTVHADSGDRVEDTTGALRACPAAG